MYNTICGNWNFGSTELISTISAALTFIAICVSLFLSQKAKTVKCKIIDKKINTEKFRNNQYQTFYILNNGHIKFTCTQVGYCIDNKYYYTTSTSGIKKYDYNIENKSGNKRVLLPVYVHEGDILELNLFPGDFDFSNILHNKKVFFFIIINGRKRHYYTGIRFREFSKLSLDFDKKSIYNDIGLHGNKERNINTSFFRKV